MAEQLERTPRRRTFYPWHDWTNGKTWRAKEGDDFTCGVQQFQNAVHQEARNRGMKAQTGSPEPGVVEFTFWTPDA